jgi:hypothetical protein
MPPHQLPPKPGVALIKAGHIRPMLADEPVEPGIGRHERVKKMGPAGVWPAQKCCGLEDTGPGRKKVQPPTFKLISHHLAIEEQPRPFAGGSAVA